MLQPWLLPFLFTVLVAGPAAEGFWLLWTLRCPTAAPGAWWDHSDHQPWAAVCADAGRLQGLHPCWVFLVQKWREMFVTDQILSGPVLLRICFHEQTRKAEWYKVIFHRQGMACVSHSFMWESVAAFVHRCVLMGVFRAVQEEGSCSSGSSCMAIFRAEPGDAVRPGVPGVSHGSCTPRASLGAVLVMAQGLWPLSH